MSSTTNDGLKRKQQSDASLVELERPPVKIRNLDFSKDGTLTLASEVQQYFNNENGRDKILKVNMRNTECMKSGRMLNNSIGRASNLVDINIHGIEFKDIWQFGSFINTMPNVRRLSFDWSEARDSCIPMCCKILQQPFSRLEYLSVEMRFIDYLKVFISLLRLCQELETLRLVVKKSSQTSYSDSWSGEPKELKNLQVVKYCGPLATQIKERLVTLLPNPENWVDFKLDCSSKPKGFHLCIVGICKELVDRKWIERVQNIMPQNHSKLGWCLVPELLLKEVLQITCENVPEEFCCFSKSMDMERCLLKIDEAKRLLKNPKSQISCFYKNWDLDELCLIRKWKHLESLHLLNIPIENGEFLIEIGKQCKNLQNLRLQRLGPWDNCCYAKELLQMLKICKNLRDFSIETRTFTETSEMLSLLSNNVHLRRLYTKITCADRCTLYDQSFFIPIFRALLGQCSELTTLVGEFDCSFHDLSCIKGSEIQQRWMKKLDRPHLQTKMKWNSLVSGTISEDSPDPQPFPEI